MHFGFLGVKAKPLDEELWARMQVEWQANGPGKRALMRAIYAGRSDGAGALTSEGDPIQGGAPLDRSGWRSIRPWARCFATSAARGTPFPSVLVSEFELNSDISYGECEVCDPTLTKSF